MSINSTPSGKAVLLNGEIQAEPENQSQQKILNELTQLALQSTDAALFIQQLTDLLQPFFKTDYFALFEKEVEGTSFLLKAGWGWKPELIGQAKLDGGLDTQAAFVFNNGDSIGFEKQFSVSNLLLDHQIVNGMTAVLPGKERPYGILAVYTCDKERVFTHAEFDFLRKIANKLALVLDRQRLEHILFEEKDERHIILDSITDGLTIQGHGGKLLYANQVAADLLGFANPEAMLAIDIGDVLNKFAIFDLMDKPFPIKRFPGRRALTGETKAAEIVRFSEIETGNDRWFMIKASPVLDNSQQVKYAVNIFQDITDMKRAENDQAFLSDVSTLLASSLDYKRLLKRIADMTVKYVADWCVVHVVNEDGSIERVSTTHKNPDKIYLARELQEKYPPQPAFKHGAYKVIQTGEAEYFPQISDDGIRGLAQDEEHLYLMRVLGFCSAMVLPMQVRGRVLGAISFVWAEPNGYYTERQSYLAGELTRRSALALDNVRLYEKEQALNIELEAKVKRRTALLEQTVEKLNDEINERKRMEKDLSRSRALLSDLFDLSPDALFLVNREGEILRANLQAQAVFGYEHDELIGSSIDRLLPERFRDLHLNHRGNFQHNSKRRMMGANLELFGMKKSGDEFPVDVMLSPVKVEEEWLVISAVRDMTEQQRIQAELAEVQHRLIDSQETERLLLAQELHDGIIQELFSINFQLSEVENDLQQAGMEAISRKIQTSSQMTQQVVQGLRHISRNLRPPALNPFGLEQAIHSHMENFREMHPELTVDLDLTPDEDLLDDRLRLVLFRIYQNAVSNVARHAKAAHVWIKLSFDENQLFLEIKDDGLGFEMPIRWVKLAREGHLGLVGTRERVDAIGGKLEIESAPGQGTLIRVVVPLP